MNTLVKNVLTIVATVALVYFANKGLNTYWGNKAINELEFTVHTLQEAKQIAAQEGKLVLADYSAIWCPSCRKLDEQVFADQNIAHLVNKDFVYARLQYDTEEGIAFAKQHDLVGFPQILVLSSTGTKLTQMPLTFNPLEYEMNLATVTRAFASK